MSDDGSDRPCGDCGHPFDPHVLVAFDPGDIPAGGLMFCPECECVSTWSVEGRGRPAMPPPGIVAQWRSAALGLPEAERRAGVGELAAALRAEREA